MKRLFVIICVAVMCMVSAQAQKVYANSSDGYVNMREEPNADAVIIDVLFNGGKPAQLIDRKGKWLHIAYDGQKGYVNSKYVAVGAKPAAKPLMRTLYYVVVESYSTLEAAKKRAEDMPDALCTPVYRAQEKGNIHYRLCNACFTDHKLAEAHVGELKEMFGFDAWIWPTRGFAECVYRPQSLYDGMLNVPPHTPRVK